MKRIVRRGDRDQLGPDGQRLVDFMEKVYDVIAAHNVEFPKDATHDIEILAVNIVGQLVAPHGPLWIERLEAINVGIVQFVAEKHATADLIGPTKGSA